MIPSMRRILYLLATGLVLAVGACGRRSGHDTISLGEAPPDTATALWSDSPALSAEAIEQGRLDESWRAAPSVDSVLHGEVPADTIALGLTGAPRDSTASRAPKVGLPLDTKGEGLDVLYVQVLLDRSPFSPGILDGHWGKNTEKAVFWLQTREGLDPTGVVDSTTFARLRGLAGFPARYVRTVALGPADVGGPFARVPADWYAQAKLRCTCYRSPGEQVAERWHASPELLARLNPEVALDSLAVGDSLVVPAVEPTDLTRAGLPASAPPDTAAGADTTAGPADTTAGADSTAAPAADAIARVVISVRGFYLHALDADGRILYHFPTTLGSEYTPSPTGEFSVVSVTFDPWFHYQPDLLEGRETGQPDARIPPGPNSPVGIVWVALSADHYGIHGTSDPQTIGYVTSHGCVRLTNWDARFLAARLRPGTPVEFRDVERRAPGAPPAAPDRD